MDASARRTSPGRLIVSVFSILSLAGLFTLWMGAPRAVTAESGAPARTLASVQVPAQPPAQAASQAQPSSWPRPANDPLDLTPERLRLLEQSGDLLRRAQEREEKVALRERILDAGRAELERKVALFERDAAGSRERLRESLEGELADRRQRLDEMEKALAEREAAVARVQEDMKRQVGQQFDQIVSSYLGLKPKRAARILEERGATEAAVILFLMPDDARTRILGEMEPGVVATILKTPFAERIMPGRSAASPRPQP